MKTERLQLALERLQAGDWARFERFSSQYLVSDYPDLRTVATPSGDLGRDSELFSPTGDPRVLLQYSVTANWQSKIRQTAERVRENFKDAHILIYVTNQQIGANADELKKEIRKNFAFILDVHDKGWFLDRLNSKHREKLAEELAQEKVDPYLASRGVVESKAPALTEFEAKAAVLHLQLQWEDDTRDRGLTKICFDALVKSVLRDTSSEQRMKRPMLRQRVHSLLPAMTEDFIAIHVDTALDRLDKRVVRNWKAEDEVCLTHEETLRVKEGLAVKETKDNALLEELTLTLKDYFGNPPGEELLQRLALRTRRVLDEFLMRKGEEFAAAVAGKRGLVVRDDTVDVIVANDFAARPDDTGLGDSAVFAVRRTTVEVVQRGKDSVQKYLRQIADGYTLFGFLKAVPDVQKIVRQIFSEGEIWIDTSVLLPVLAETLLDENEAIVSRLLKTAIEAGLELRVTTGVVEEVERHINRCITFTRTGRAQWIGGVPFLYAMYALTGGTPDSFLHWVGNFCGKERPRDDIAEYFREVWKVKLADLGEFVEATEKNLRWEVERIWREAHEARRNANGREFDAYIIDRLANHDVECFLGVIGKRGRGGNSELGYVEWWLTFDKTVRDFEQKLRESLGSDAPKAPTMSPDFLADYLAVGPRRAHVSKQTESQLPVGLFDLLPDHIPLELIDIAEQVRKDCVGLDERLIRRKLRDRLDSLKRKPGILAKGGFAGVREGLETSLRAQRE